MDYIAGVLRDAGIESEGVLLLTVLIFVGVFFPVLAALYLLLRRMSWPGRTNIDVKWNFKTPRDSASDGIAAKTPGSFHGNSFGDSAARDLSEKTTLDLRSLLKKIYKTLTLLIAAFLLFGAIMAYRAATPGNGLLLVSGILAVLAFITFLSAGKLDRMDANGESYRSIADSFLSKAQISTVVASPEVHVLDNEALARAQQMSHDGKSLDEICRAMNYEYENWSPAHQEAFQRVMQSALEHSR